MTCRTTSCLLVINLFIPLPTQKLRIFISHQLRRNAPPKSYADPSGLLSPRTTFAPLYLLPPVKSNFDYTLYSRTVKKKQAKRCLISQNPVVLRVWKRLKSSLLTIISRTSKKGFSGLGLIIFPPHPLLIEIYPRFLHALIRLLRAGLRRSMLFFIDELMYIYL